MNRMLSVKGGIGFTSLVLIILTTSGFSGPPPEANLQGTLESPEGAPVSGAHEYLIRFFEVPVGGAAISAATGIAELSEAGRFSIAIPVEPELLAFDELWYEFAVDTGDDGLDPNDAFPERVKVHSVPFALLARDTELLGGTPAEAYSTDEEREIALEWKAPLDHGHDDQYWSLHGNVLAGTEPAFLGALDDAPVALGTRSQPALRLEPSGGTTNIIAGFPGNTVVEGASGGAIGGGGREGAENAVTAVFGTIGGGSGNTAGDWATVAGGQANSAVGSFSSVAGGWTNAANREYSTVGGGAQNLADGGYATVPGGSGNVAQGDYSLAAGRRAKANHAGCFVWGDSVDADVTSTAEDQFVVRANGGVSCFTGAGGLRLSANNISPNITAGFNDNDISPEVVGAAISGGGTNGAENRVTDNYGAIGGGKGNLVGNDGGTTIDASHATVSGGRDNVAAGMYAVVGGGWDNAANAFCATIGGGGRTTAGDPNTNNRVTDDFGTIGGGGNNGAGNGNPDATDAKYATISGGDWNTASETNATVGGGYQNTAGGANAVVSGGSQNEATQFSATVGGGSMNWATGARSTIAGGGSNRAPGQGTVIAGGDSNQASGDNATVGGGHTNVAAAFSSTVAGGAVNSASASWAAIGGGNWNKVRDENSTVAGGNNNLAGSDNGDPMDCRFATVSGGAWNVASAACATISGGSENHIVESPFDYIPEYATIGGGHNNTVEGWIGNMLAWGMGATIGGGGENTVSENYATVGGGFRNAANGSFSTIGGGEDNNVVGDAFDATIGGGLGNSAGAFWSTVPGGFHNSAAGVGSFAAGTRAKANHEGTFVWGDSQPADIASTAADQVTFRCQGGVRFLSGSGGGNQTVSWTPGSSSWTFSSDRNLKEGFKPVDGGEMLRKVSELPIAEWNFKGYEPRHVGPTAQDFHAVFGLGGSETMIDGGDLHGVALAAIQGLRVMVKERDARITAQERMIQDLKARNQEIEDRLSLLETRLTSIAVDGSGVVR